MLDSCEHANEPSVSIKCWEILEQMSDWWFLKKGSAPWKLLNALKYVVATRLIPSPPFSFDAHESTIFTCTEEQPVAELVIDEG
jgi:hypothetical protein